MTKIIHAIDKLLEAVLTLAMLGILLAVTVQVVTRKVFDDPLAGTEELARFLLIWIGILGAAYAYRKKAHLGFNLIMERLPARKRMWLQTVVEVLVLVFCALVMVLGGTELVSMTLELEQISAALQVPVGFIYTVLPISGVLIMLFSLVNIVEVWQGKDVSQHYEEEMQ